MNDRIILKHIFYDASMASFSLIKLLDNLEKDNKIQDAMSDILNKYEIFAKETNKILSLEEKHVKHPSFMTKMMITHGIKKHILKDSSDKALSLMLIKGIKMGKKDMDHLLKKQQQKITFSIKEIAKNFMLFQEQAILKLKDYLE